MLVHPPAVRAEAVRLVGEGLSERAVARRLGVHRNSVANWRRAQASSAPPPPACPRCWSPLDRPIAWSAPLYAFVLTAYLGDGHVVRPSPGSVTWRLSMTLDDALPGIQDVVELALRRLLPGSPVARVAKPGCHAVTVHHRHLPCLLPQHGPGRKHERALVFEPWQLAVVDEHPWEVLRGAVLTDGCSFVNWAPRPGGGRYEYLSFGFSNASDDVHDLVARASDRIGLRPRRSGRTLRWARRPDVARLERHVGEKRHACARRAGVLWEFGAVGHQLLEPPAARDALAAPAPRAEHGPSGCADCGAPVSRRAARCKPCAGVARERTRIAWPASEDLAREVAASSCAAVGRRLGVSDVAVRKRLRRHPPPG